MNVDWSASNQTWKMKNVIFFINKDAILHETGHSIKYLKYNIFNLNSLHMQQHKASFHYETFKWNWILDGVLLVDYIT